MAHQLDPPPGSPALSPDEIERRLRAEFVYVDADAAAGAEVVADMIRCFERLNAPFEIIDEHRRLEHSAVRFIVADAPDFVDAYLCFTALRGKGFLIGYHSRGHEREAAPLHERCARVLGYDVNLL